MKEIQVRNLAPAEWLIDAKKPICYECWKDEITPKKIEEMKEGLEFFPDLDPETNARLMI